MLKFGRSVIWGFVFAGGVGAVAHAQEADSALSATQALLTITALLSVSLLIVAIFSLWQSHRMYLDTVRLHQTLTDAHQTFLTRVLPTTASRPPQTSGAMVQVVPPVSDQPVRTDAVSRADEGNMLDGLSDVEWAILEKLAADPAYFTQHSIQSFGGSQATIDGLLRRGAARLDGLGRPAVPNEVQTALRARLA